MKGKVFCAVFLCFCFRKNERYAAQRIFCAVLRLTKLQNKCLTTKYFGFGRLLNHFWSFVGFFHAPQIFLVRCICCCIFFIFVARFWAVAKMAFAQNWSLIILFSPKKTQKWHLAAQ